MWVKGRPVLSKRERGYGSIVTSPIWRTCRARPLASVVTSSCRRSQRTPCSCGSIMRGHRWHCISVKVWGSIGEEDLNQAKEHNWDVIIRVHAELNTWLAAASSSLQRSRRTRQSQKQIMLTYNRQENNGVANFSMIYTC